MSDSQRARDYADQKQFKADIQTFTQNNYYDIDGEEAKAYLVRLFNDNYPKLHAEAMKVATSCAEEMAVAVIAEIHEDDASKMTNLRKPSAQSALLAARESYARTGDPDTGQGDVVLGQLLAKLVARAIVESTRSLQEIALRRAIDVAPNLTENQFNTLSVASVVTALRFNGIDIDELITNMDEFLSPYYGKVITKYIELSYMAASGVGSFGAVLFGSDIAQVVRDRHKAALSKGFDLQAVPAEVTQQLRDDYFEPDRRTGNFLRIRPDRIDELTSSPNSVEDMAKSFKTGVNDIFSDSAKPMRKLRVFASAQLYTTEELKKAVGEKAPRLLDFMNQLDQAGVMNFTMNTIGYILASQELSLRYPGTNLLGPLIELESPSSADAAGPRSNQ